MKIRNGFVSNSSSSSFVLVYLPEDFDYDARMEYLIDKFKGKKKYYMDEIENLTKNDLDQLKKRGVYNQNDGDDKFWQLVTFLQDFTLLSEEAPEECGVIRLINKKFLDKLSNLDIAVKETNNKYKEQVTFKKQKREEMKDKMKHIDPYGEETWEDTDESYKIKRLK